VAARARLPAGLACPGSGILGQAHSPRAHLPHSEV